MTTPITSGMSTTPVRSTAGGKLGKDEFLKMLVAQLRHQDPMNPMDGTQMASQLAQFSSVEQLVNIGAKLEQQRLLTDGMMETMTQVSAMGAIGRNVVAIGDEVVLTSSPQDRVMFAAASGGNAKLEILDESGRVLGSRNLGYVGAGKHTVDVGAAGSGLPGDRYRFRVTISDTDGSEIPSTTFTTGRVDGLRFGPQGPVLTSGPLSIALPNVLELTAGN